MALRRTGRRLVFFLLRLLLLYGLLIAPWPGVREAYAAMFRAGGTLLFSSFGSDGQVRFRPAPQAKGGNDVQLICTNRRVPQAVGKASCNSFLRGYFPTAFVIALVLATPLPWSRRWKALLWGLLLVNAFVAFRMVLLIVQVFSGDYAGALFDLSPLGHRILKEVIANLVHAPVSHFVVPLFIWIVVTLRRNDIEAWFAGAAAKESTGAGPTKACKDRARRPASRQSE